MEEFALELLAPHLPDRLKHHVIQAHEALSPAHFLPTNKPEADGIQRHRNSFLKDTSSNTEREPYFMIESNQPDSPMSVRSRSAKRRRTNRRVSYPLREKGVLSDNEYSLDFSENSNENKGENQDQAAHL